MIAISRNKLIGMSLLLGAVVLIIAWASPSVAIGRSNLQAAGGLTTMICTTGPTFNLQAAGGYIDMPDGNSLYMWGFKENSGSFQIPGPVLCVNEGDTVTINLTNNLLGSEPVSMVFPGQMGVTATGGSPGLLAAEAAPGGGTVTYSFIADEPGTYLYESGTNTHKQVHMGLYGVLVVRPALGANYAYNDPATQFDPDQEYLLVMHDLDPLLHQAVEFGLSYDITTRHDRYWTINGRGAVDTLLDNNVVWLPSQPYSALVRVEAGAALPALIRYANAGTVNHPFHPHGNTMQVIGRDGRFLGDARLENFTTTLGAGQTFDLLFRWDNVEGWTPGPNGNIPDNPKFPFPELGNLVFKDDVTFYSGDPYLGQQGALPTGVTSFNACGEFYFPWHSHALHEIQNWNEGFGGMLTLVRVDPPGGCP